MKTENLTKKRILTGDNTTGRLHIGHYVGSLENRVRLQDEYETIIVLADLHALAYPKYVASPDIVSDSIFQVAVDNLAVGIDPDKSYIFPDSAVPEISEIALIFSMLISHNRALRNPTLKEEIRDKNLGDNFSVGFINFPILMAADILSVNADLVPVGEDQAPHLELAREIVQKFNNTYGGVFKEPEGLIGRVPRLVGTGGKAKMTKSLDNVIYLSDDSVTLKKQVMSMFTDPKRIHADDPGSVEGNTVFLYHDIFNSNKEEVAELKARYKKGTVGDVEVKEKLFVVLDNILSPIREKRKYYENHRDEVFDILKTGTLKVSEEAKKTLENMREKMKLPRFS